MTKPPIKIFFTISPHIVLLFSLFLSGCQRIPVDEMVKIFEKHSYKEFDSNELRASLKKEGIWGLKKYDKYAEIVDPAKFDRTPKFGADKAQIGVLLQKNRDGFFYVSKVFKNSSADRLELKEGAKLLKIDRTLASRLSELEAEFLLTGKAGTRLHAIFEAENGKVLKLGLERGHGFNPMVWGTMTETAGYGYIKISAFVKNISRILEKEALVLTKAGAHTLILDLRSVSAGSFEGAAECAGIFIGNGRGLFTIDSRHRGYAAAFSARPGISAFSKTRFIILVNSQTSSSAEIFAQTMKELLGARVFGTRTGGNVMIAKIFKLSNGRGLKLSIAKMLPASGKSLEDEGILPDIEIECKTDFVLPPVVLRADACYAKAMEVLLKQTAKRQ